MTKITKLTLNGIDFQMGAGGVSPITKGGTGAGDAATARDNLQVAAVGHGHVAANVSDLDENTQRLAREYYESSVNRYQSMVLDLIEAWGTDAMYPLVSQMESAFNGNAEAQAVARRYLIGKTLYVNMGDTYGGVVPFQCIGCFEDEKTSGGMALLTFMCVPIIASCGMSSSSSTDGGWKESFIRTSVVSNLLNAMDASVKSNIVAVNKRYMPKYGNPSSVTVTSDRIFLASDSEVFGDAAASMVEGSQYTYWKLHDSSDSRIKRQTSNNYAYRWVLRTPSSGTSWVVVSNVGGRSSERYNVGCGVVPCFCI